MTTDQAFRIVACVDYDIAKEWELDSPELLMNTANEIQTIIEERR